MNTKTCFDYPGRKYIFPTKYMGEEEMITNRQRRALTELIYANFQGDEKELRLSQIDDLTSSEALDEICSISTGKWR
jgi:hypothetical protein